MCALQTGVHLASPFTDTKDTVKQTQFLHSKLANKVNFLSGKFGTTDSDCGVCI